MNTTTMTNQEKALALAAHGIPVVRCRAEAETIDGKTFERKSPVGGYAHSTTDPETIRAWWAGRDYLPGIAPGDGVVVADIDVKHGKDGFAALAERGYELPDTLNYATPSGGRHYVYRVDGMAGQVRVPGVEVQGRGTVAVWYGDVPKTLTLAEAPAWAVNKGNAQTVTVANSEEVTAYLESLGDRDMSDHVAAVLADVSTREGDHSTLWSKISDLFHAVNVRGAYEYRAKAGRDVFDALHDALEAGYVEKYGQAKWASEWEGAMSHFVGQHNANVAELDADLRTQEEYGRYLANLPEAELIEHFGLDPVGWAEEVVTEVSGTPAPFRIVTRSELRDRPKPDWLIADMVQGSGVVILAGEGGLGKSFLSLDWSARVATGTAWNGKAVKAGKVLYVAAEGVEFFHDRLTAWEKFNRTTVPDDRLLYVEEGFSLSSPAAVEYMRQVVTDEAIDLIVLDTLSQLSDVENENDNAQLSRVLRQAKAIREVRPGASVLIVHHVNKSERGRVRGAGAIRNNADAVIVARAKGDTFTLSTRVEDDGKQKNATAVALPGFYLSDFAGSAVIERREAPDADSEAIDSVLSDEEWHSVSEFLAARGDNSDAASKRLRRRLDQRSDVEKTGTGRGTKWRLVS